MPPPTNIRGYFGQRPVEGINMMNQHMDDEKTFEVSPDDSPRAPITCGKCLQLLDLCSQVLVCCSKRLCVTCLHTNDKRRNDPNVCPICKDDEAYHDQHRLLMRIHPHPPSASDVKNQELRATGSKQYQYLSSSVIPKMRSLVAGFHEELRKNEFPISSTLREVSARQSDDRVLHRMITREEEKIIAYWVKVHALQRTIASSVEEINSLMNNIGETQAFVFVIRDHKVMKGR